jgi:hypothetical protein
LFEGLFDNGNRECVWEKLDQILGHIKVEFKGDKRSCFKVGDTIA